MIRKVYEVSERNQIIAAHADRESAEKKIGAHNKKHLIKAYQSEVYLDRMYLKLREDEVRDKTLQGQVSSEECDSKNLPAFKVIENFWLLEKFGNWKTPSNYFD